MLLESDGRKWRLACSIWSADLRAHVGVLKVKGMKKKQISHISQLQPSQKSAVKVTGGDSKTTGVRFPCVFLPLAEELHFPGIE